MPQPLIVGMTPDIVVSGNYIVRVTALSPTTGALVSGVKVSLAAASVRDLAPSDSEIVEPEPISPSPVTGAYTTA